MGIKSIPARLHDVRGLICQLYPQDTPGKNRHRKIRQESKAPTLKPSFLPRFLLRLEALKWLKGLTKIIPSPLDSHDKATPPCYTSWNCLVFGWPVHKLQQPGRNKEDLDHLSYSSSHNHASVGHGVLEDASGFAPKMGYGLHLPWLLENPSKQQKHTKIC